ncbi:hypothetical protein [Streptomyces viridosporus]
MRGPVELTQFGTVPVDDIRSTLALLTREQHERNQAAGLEAAA